MAVTKVKRKTVVKKGKKTSVPKTVKKAIKPGRPDVGRAEQWLRDHPKFVNTAIHWIDKWEDVRSRRYDKYFANPYFGLRGRMAEKRKVDDPTPPPYKKTILKKKKMLRNQPSEPWVNPVQKPIVYKGHKGNWLKRKLYFKRYKL